LAFALCLDRSRKALEIMGARKLVRERARSRMSREHRICVKSQSNLQETYLL
jgi:hypothetical protein